MEIDMKRHLNL